MELKNKYSKQIIYSNQKFEDQIWYNQQIMTFLNFSQLPEKCFPPKFSGKHFPENQAKFFFDWKCFPLTNFSEDKQTQESLESGFPETTFLETNKALMGISSTNLEVFWLGRLVVKVIMVFTWSLFWENGLKKEFLGKKNILPDFSNHLCRG